MRPTRGKKKAPKTPKKPQHRWPDDEFVEIDWDLINSMPDANSHSEDTTVVEEIPTFNCPDDDSTVGKDVESYEMTEQEKWDIFVGTMCDIDFDAVKTDLRKLFSDSQVRQWCSACAVSLCCRLMGPPVRGPAWACKTFGT